VKSIGLETELELDFDLAKRIAEGVASACLGEYICLSWFDQAAGQECPSHASDCHGSCETPGYLEYAIHRGAELRVDLKAGRFVFCFRPLGEFAPDR
jgi:Domain of unknown function (DUF5619)